MDGSLAANSTDGLLLINRLESCNCVVAVPGLAGDQELDARDEAGKLPAAHQ